MRDITLDEFVMMCIKTGWVERTEIEGRRRKRRRREEIRLMGKKSDCVILVYHSNPQNNPAYFECKVGV